MTHGLPRGPAFALVALAAVALAGPATAHGAGCPIGPGDVDTWPCFARERRNDLGLRHTVAALARRGFVAIAPDLNAAYTFGWGEPDDRVRWPRIVNRTLRELVEDEATGEMRFGVPVQGRLDLTRLGLLGHSLSGRNSVRLAHLRADNTSPEGIAAARGPVSALFLLAPVAHGRRLPDIESAVVVAGCDGDVGDGPRLHLRRARRTPGRTEPVFLPTLERANHNYFNRAMARAGFDDGRMATPRCRRSRRLRPHQQIDWLDRAAPAYFAAQWRGVARPSWMRLSGRLPHRAHGRKVTVERFVP